MALFNSAFVKVLDILFLKVVFLKSVLLIYILLVGTQNSST